MVGWGDVPTGSKNNGLNQPNAQEPCLAHVIQNRVESRALQANSCDNLNKGHCKLGQVKGDYSGRERANSYAPPDIQCIVQHAIRTCCGVQHVIRMWIVPGTRDLESMVAHRFVKYGFKVLLHRVVDGPLQASRCLVLQSLNEPRSFIPSIPVYFGPKHVSARHNSARRLAEAPAGASFEFTAKVKVNHSIKLMSSLYDAQAAR